MQKPGLKQLIQEIHRRGLWQVLGICLLAVSTPLLAGEQGRTTEQIVAECDRLAASPKSLQAIMALGRSSSGGWVSSVRRPMLGPDISGCLASLRWP